MISVLFPLNRWMNAIAFTWLFGSLSLSNVSAARECHFYANSAGVRRRSCYGMLPGIIAAVIVGVLVILGFASLAWILRRRRQRALSQNQPVFTHESINNLMSQPPAYPPPNYPLATMPNQPTNPPREYGEEKHELDPNNPVQPPPQATLPSHHANQ